MNLKKNTILSFLNGWIRSIDIINIFLILSLILLGVLFVTSASPSVAKLKNLNEFYFIKKHYIFVLFSIFIMIIFSFFSAKGLLNISYLGCCISMILIGILFLINIENNGSIRWINFVGFSFQPTELLKPFIIIVFASLLNLKKKFLIRGITFNGRLIAFLLLLFVSFLILAQPNFSMFIILFLVFTFQYIAVGINLRFLIIILSSIFLFTVFAYTNLDHVKYRVDSFFNPNKTHFQVEKSLEAYQSGGLLGKGPGQGTIKKYIPDSHTDFIFPVIAEEYGSIICILILSISLLIFFRGIRNISSSSSLFKVTCCTGLLTLFLIQALINMAVSMKLIPTTGVTFPFLSYGGSSLISMGIVMGMILALTKKRFKEKGLIYE